MKSSASLLFLSLLHAFLSYSDFTGVILSLLDFTNSPELRFNKIRKVSALSSTEVSNDLFNDFFIDNCFDSTISNCIINLRKVLSKTSFFDQTFFVKERLRVNSTGGILTILLVRLRVNDPVLKNGASDLSHRKKIKTDTSSNRSLLAKDAGNVMQDDFFLFDISQQPGSL
jgi:hypothetical protein